MFGFGTILYLFAAGAGAGLYVVKTCFDPRCELKGRGPRDMQILERKVLLLAPVLVCVGSLFLVLDLTRPERFLLVFRSPDTSLISLGACLLVAFVVLLVLENALWSMSGSLVARVSAVVRICASIIAVAVILYTGFFLMGMKAIPFWRSPFVVALFTASSLSSGIALFLVLFAAAARRSKAPRFVRRASLTDAGLAVVELGLLASFLAVQSGGNPASFEACQRLLTGDLAWAFWVMLVGVGLLCPLAIDLVTKGAEAPRACAAKGLAVLVGCFFLRYCIMEAGVRVLSLQ